MGHRAWGRGQQTEGGRPGGREAEKLGRWEGGRPGS